MKTLITLGTMLFYVACGGGGGSSTNDTEVITTVIVNFASTTGAVVSATFNDPDGDGGQAPTVDPVALTPGNYTLTVQFQNRLTVPTQEITDEVADEQDVHLLLFTGDAVVGPATNNQVGPLAQSYADMDANGLPVGLRNNIVATAGAGQFTVTLRHMPPEAPPEKSATTVTDAKTGGIESIGGTTDAEVTFSVAVPL